MKYGIIVSEFNTEIVEGLLEQCLRGFEKHGYEVDVIRVPGAVEIPLAALDYIEKKQPEAVVALGCVVKGDTDHYQAVCLMCQNGIMEVMLKTKTPIIFEVLMVDDEKKALARLDKGFHAAESAIRMGKLIDTF